MKANGFYQYFVVEDELRLDFLIKNQSILSRFFSRSVIAFGLFDSSIQFILSKFFSSILIAFGYLTINPNSLYLDFFYYMNGVMIF